MVARAGTRPAVRAGALAAGLALLLVSCTGGSSASSPTSGPAGGSSASVTASAAPSVPNLDPIASLPTDAATVAADLQITARKLGAALASWTDLSQSAPDDVQLLALHQQRLYSELAGSPALATATSSLLSGRLAWETRANVEATAAIRSSVTPSKDPPSFQTGAPDPAADLRAAYDEAEARFGVAWEVLAAVNLVETRFGRVRSASYASARGPMQFIPATWKAYGLGGNVHDSHDAILGAANYLAASGAPADYRAALGHYNPSKSYVKAVWLYARVMMRDPQAFLAYYNWQVFVITTNGDVQLTGPGAASG